MKSELHKGMLFEVQRIIKQLEKKREKLKSTDKEPESREQIYCSAQVKLLSRLIANLRQREERLINVGND